MILAGDEPIVHGRIRALYRYWESKRVGTRFPGRAGIDPVDIPLILSHVLLVDVRREPLRFFFRVAGGAADAIFGHQVTGLYLHQIRDTHLYDVEKAQYREPVDTGQPCYHRNEAVDREGEIFRYERVLLPLSEDGETIDKLIGGVALLPLGAGDRRFVFEPGAGGRVVALVGVSDPLIA